MDIEEDKKGDEKDDTVEPETVSGLGLLLKEGGGKKGLDYEEMAQITKLRAHALEALENEAWHLLPPPVFVKGFIKSYAMAPVSVSPTVTESLVLTGRFRSETYVKIYVDDRAPKEYVFKPGSEPQREAKEGFYMMVGNASGIEFDLNGKVYGNLGKEGDVVRLRLPEDFRRQIFEE